MAEMCDPENVSNQPASNDPVKIAEDWFEKLCSAAKSAARKSLPTKAESVLTQRMVSQRTKNLIKQKRSLRKDKKALKLIKAKIKESCLQDFKAWVSDTVSDIEKANELGDVRKIFNLVNLLSNKPKAPPCNLTKDDEGNLLNSPENTVERWRKFLKNTFKATSAEALRPDVEVLPKTDDKITWTEFEDAVNHLKLGKTIGPDGIPSEVYKFCPVIKNELFYLLSFIWDEEVVPPSLVMANFRMLYKHKGSRDDPSRYRCLALLNHAYKVLSHILLGRLVGISDSFLKD